MSDNIQVTIGKKEIRRITRVTIDSNIYNAAGEFRVDMHPDYISTVNAGDRCAITIDGIVAIDAIIDRKGDSGEKGSSTFSITGRDLMGLVADCHIESFSTLRNKKLRDVAELYLRNIDYVKKCTITYLDGAGDLDVDQEYVQPAPGMTVFNLLSGIAAARGIYFYMRPDGNIVFGKPKGFGGNTFFVYRTNSRNTNIVHHDFYDDISQRFSRVTVLGQDESTRTTTISGINKKAIVSDDTFPAFGKPLVIETNTAAKSVSQQARMIIEQQRFAGWAVMYTLAGFSQRGHVWSPDTICAVDDSHLNIREECLVYGRRFDYRKGEKYTSVILGKMGVAA